MCILWYYMKDKVNYYCYNVNSDGQTNKMRGIDEFFSLIFISNNYIYALVYCTIIH